MCWRILWRAYEGLEPWGILEQPLQRTPWAQMLCLATRGTWMPRFAAVCAHMRMCACVCIFVCMFLYFRVGMCVSVYTAYICVYVCVRVCMCVCISVTVCVGTHMNVCIRVCVSAHMCQYVYV